ncbi:MAG: hypothetical protein AAFU71_10160 [Cyanobacteria bacterium J06632_22]
MALSQFDPTAWHHWLLIVCVLGMSGLASWLSWHWCYSPRAKRERMQQHQHYRYQRQQNRR